MELRELAPVILTATAAADEGYTVTFEGEAVSPCPLRALLKPHSDGGYVLFTVNLDAAVLRARFDFDSRLRRVTPMFENRDDILPADGDRAFADDYEPFDTHLYRIEVNAGAGDGGSATPGAGPERPARRKTG